MNNNLPRMKNPPPPPNKKPTLVENPNLDKLQQACQNFVDYCFNDDYNEDQASDYEHHIFQEAICALFGDDAFDKTSKSIEQIQERQE